MANFIFPFLILKYDNWKKKNNFFYYVVYCLWYKVKMVFFGGNQKQTL